MPAEAPQPVQPIVPEASRPPVREQLTPEQQIQKDHEVRRQTAEARKPVIEATKNILQARSTVQPEARWRRLFGGGKRRAFAELTGRAQTVQSVEGLADRKSLSEEQKTVLADKVRTDVEKIYRFTGKGWEKRVEGLSPDQILDDAADYTGAIARELVLAKYLDQSAAEIAIQGQLREIVMADPTKPLESKKFIGKFIERTKATTRSRRELGRVKSRLALDEGSRRQLDSAFSEVYTKKDAESPDLSLDRENKRNALIMDAARPWGFSEEDVTNAFANPDGITDEALKGFVDSIQIHDPVIEDVLNGEGNEMKARSELVALSETTDITAIRTGIKEVRAKRLDRRVAEKDLKLFYAHEEGNANLVKAGNELVRLGNARKAITMEGYAARTAVTVTGNEAEDKAKKIQTDESAKIAVAEQQRRYEDRMDDAMFNGIRRFRRSVTERVGGVIDAHDGLVRSHIEATGIKRGLREGVQMRGKLDEIQEFAKHESAGRIGVSELDRELAAWGGIGTASSAEATSGSNVSGETTTQTQPRTESTSGSASQSTGETTTARENPQPQKASVEAPGGSHAAAEVSGSNGVEGAEAMSSNEQAWQVFQEYYKNIHEPLRQQVADIPAGRNTPEDVLARFQLKQIDNAMIQLASKDAAAPIGDRMAFDTGLTYGPDNKPVIIDMPTIKKVVDEVIDVKNLISTNKGVFDRVGGVAVPNVEKRQRRDALKAEIKQFAAGLEPPLTDERTINKVFDKYLEEIRVLDPQKVDQFSRDRASADGANKTGPAGEQADTTTPSGSTESQTVPPVRGGSGESGSSTTTGTGGGAASSAESPATRTAQTSEQTEATVATEQNDPDREIKQETYDVVVGAMEKQLQFLRSKPLADGEKPVRDFEIFQLEKALQQAREHDATDPNALSVNSGITIEQNGQRRELQAGMPILADTLEEWELLTTTDHGQGLNGTEIRQLLEYRDLMKNAASGLSPEQQSVFRSGVEEAIRKYRMESGSQLFSPSDENAAISRIADAHLSQIRIINPEKAREYVRSKKPQPEQPLGSIRLEDVPTNPRPVENSSPTGGIDLDSLTMEAPISVGEIHSTEQKVVREAPKNQEEMVKKYRDETAKVIDGYEDVLAAAEAVRSSDKNPNPNLDFAINAGKAAWSEVDANKRRIGRAKRPLNEIYTTQAGDVRLGLPTYSVLTDAAHLWVENVADGNLDNLFDEAYVASLPDSAADGQPVTKADAAKARRVLATLELFENASKPATDGLNQEQINALYGREEGFIRGELGEEGMKKFGDQEIKKRAKRRIDDRSVLLPNEAVLIYGNTTERRKLNFARELDKELTKQARERAESMPGPRETEQRGIELTNKAMRSYVDFLHRKTQSSDISPRTKIEAQAAEQVLRSIESNTTGSITERLTREITSDGKNIRSGLVVSTETLSEMESEMRSLTPDKQVEQRDLLRLIKEASIAVNDKRLSSAERNAIYREQVRLAADEIRQETAAKPDSDQIIWEQARTRARQRMAELRVMKPEQVFNLMRKEPNWVRNESAMRQQVAEPTPTQSRQSTPEDPNFGRVERQRPARSQQPAEQFENLNAWVGMSDEAFNAAVRKVQVEDTSSPEDAAERTKHQEYYGKFREAHKAAVRLLKDKARVESDNQAINDALEVADIIKPQVSDNGRFIRSGSEDDFVRSLSFYVEEQVNDEWQEIPVDNAYFKTLVDTLRNPAMPTGREYADFQLERFHQLADVLEERIKLFETRQPTANPSYRATRADELTGKGAKVARRAISPLAERMRESDAAIALSELRTNEGGMATGIQELRENGSSQEAGEEVQSTVEYTPAGITPAESSTISVDTNTQPERAGLSDSILQPGRAAAEAARSAADAYQETYNEIRDGFKRDEERSEGDEQPKEITPDVVSASLPPETIDNLQVAEAGSIDSTLSSIDGAPNGGVEEGVNSIREAAQAASQGLQARLGRFRTGIGLGKKKGTTSTPTPTGFVPIVSDPSEDPAARAERIRMAREELLKGGRE